MVRLFLSDPPMTVMAAHLFTPLELGATTIPNRVMVSPMCQYSCDTDGLATEWHRTHLGSRAVGGAGIVMSEATAVEARGRITPHDLGIWSDDHAAALEPITAFIRDQGSVPAIQLAHAGRKGSKSQPWEGSVPLSEEDGGWETIAPSDVPWPYDDQPPELHEMTQADIQDVIDAFAEAAERSLDAGFEIAEVHAAHGYLIHEFLSPVTNHRSDEYGGSFENRIRFLEEIVAAVQSVWPDDKPVFVRISATDWLPDRDSWDVNQSVRLSSRLYESGVDLVDVSSGGIHPDQQLTSVGPNYQVPYAERIRTETNATVGAVGGITEPEQADALIRNERADLAIVGRQHLTDPYFTLHAAERLDTDAEKRWPIQYRRAID